MGLTDTQDHQEIVDELKALAGLLRRLSGLPLLARMKPGKGKLENNFHYADDKLMEGGGTASG